VRRGLWLVVLTAAALQGADDVPGWAREAAAQTVPGYPTKVNAVVLLREETVTIELDGKRVMRERGAVKILQQSTDTVEAYRTYNTKNGRIRDFQGWLIPPTGKATAYAKNRIVDVALSRDYVYDEARAKVLECGCSTPGSVFAWEVTEEEKSVFTQDAYTFQRQEPVLVSRFVVNLPAGWEARGIVFNRNKTEPQVSGAAYIWELRNLPWIEKEDYSPSLAALAPRVVVSYFPPTDNRAGLQGLKDWASVSTWLTPLVDPSAEVTDAVRIKALQLTVNAPGELDKIRALAAFAQQTNYVEVSLNITRGGGYTPRKADETLARNYGDCKDKATLLRSLLRAAGIDSYLTTITADDRTYVRPEWASPAQFNHAIIAIRVSDAVALPTVISDPALGRLLMFDPTDSITPVGDLPSDEQGSYALVIAGARGALLKMPLLPAHSNRIESSVEATMDANGQIHAHLQREYFGQSGSLLRAVEKLRGRAEVTKRFERGFSRQLGGTTLSGVTTQSHAEDNRLAVSLDLTAERFGQVMQGKLLIVRPGTLTSGGEYFLGSKQRSSPVKLEADLRHDSIKVKLPAGFTLDELPAPAKVESAYGTLQASWAVREGEIVMEQTLEIRETVAPASEYAQVRDFFDRVAGAQTAPVVLLKQ
jgi:transglutaminase-like putative cysteine protease